ncbi:MAG: hypothetical protein KDD61_12145 [Bdellovibrionales bacterium]|nr:hypothetical protein [Bdellovibrionales bacterium]
MNRSIKTIIGFLMMVSVSACSTQWRESDPGIDSRQLFEIIDEALPIGASSTGGSASQEFLAIAKNDPYSAIFFAEGPGRMGTVNSILGFPGDLALFGKSGRTREEVKSVIVIMAEGMIEGDDRIRYAMMVDIVFNDGDRSTVTFSSQGEREIDGKEFIVTMKGTTGEYYLRSLDVTGGELKPVIQLEFHQTDETGEPYMIGKVSTLSVFE